VVEGKRTKAMRLKQENAGKALPAEVAAEKNVYKRCSYKTGEFTQVKSK
jgi:hypothetical protein